ncbi:carbohydrate ABC transporter permease [Marinilactibacillus psychrotolerans]|nr:sugar ABC transporter permease [Marinilactibacillus psychrotolerans]GEQ32246.1 sugar ABC transporter permease protein [Marinilactibacillus psychrotolerans]
MATINIPKSKKKRLSDNVKTSIFLSPTFILLLIFFLTPMLLTIFFSFTNLALTGSQASNLEFIGFENFINMFQDTTLYNSIGKTLIFVLFSAVLGQCLLGFIIAFLMRGKHPALRRFVGISVVAAWVTPEVVVAFCWVVFLGDNGTLNNVLAALTSIEPIAFLFEYPMVSVVIANIWRGTAFSMLAFQTALDDIPVEVEEAAIIDGASRWKIVKNVTIPMLKGTFTTNLMLVTLQTLGVFTLIYTMTGGGPGGDTMVLPVFMYQQAFVSYQLGYGTAISLIILLIGGIFSLVYMKFLKVKI